MALKGGPNRQHPIPANPETVFDKAAKSLLAALSEDKPEPQPISELDDTVVRTLSAVQAALFKLTIKEEEYDKTNLTPVMRRLEEQDRVLMDERIEEVKNNLLADQSRKAIQSAQAKKRKEYLQTIIANIGDTAIHEAVVLKTISRIIDEVEKKLTQTQGVNSGSSSTPAPASSEPPVTLPHMNKRGLMAFGGFLKRMRDRIMDDTSLNGDKSKGFWYLHALTYELIDMKHAFIAASKAEPKALPLEELSVISKSWQAQKEARAKRLSAKEKKGGKLEGLVARDALWHERKPADFSYETMKLREEEAMSPYVPLQPEHVAKRKTRQAQVAGLSEVREQNGKKAVARAEVATAKKQGKALVMQSKETRDDVRHDLQDLGMLITTKTHGRETGQSMGLSEFWKEKFLRRIEHIPDGPHKFKEALVEEEVKPNFPTRKTTAATQVTPLLEHQFKLGAERGYLVGKSGAYLKPAVIAKQPEGAQSEGAKPQPKDPFQQASETLEMYRIRPFKPK